MISTPARLVLKHNYRGDGCGDAELERAAIVHLDAAADALNMAVLTLDDPNDESRPSLQRRASHCRKLLVEAVTSLSRARLYITGIRTYALPVIMSSEANPVAELGRLHQICSRLLWYNHEYLPAKSQSTPLTDEDEAQLALVIKDLASHARIGRAMRHKWLVATTLCAALIPLAGVPVGVAALACAAMATVQYFRAASTLTSYSLR